MTFCEQRLHIIAVSRTINVAGHFNAKEAEVETVMKTFGESSSILKGL